MSVEAGEVIRLMGRDGMGSQGKDSSHLAGPCSGGAVLCRGGRFILILKLLVPLLGAILSLKAALFVKPFLQHVHLYW